uniref:FecR family protein n=1 Tax=uncultured Bacteroides sp. TaxID=162156 RepID=UPI00280B983E|nr:FecR domain-containing protein [uncultured Bacteroides sp.]
MIKQDFHIANIIVRHLSGEITPEENILLENWRKEEPAHEALFQKICSEENLKRNVEKSVLFNIATGWMEVEKRIRKNNTRERTIRILRYAAAVLVPVFFLGISLKYTSRDSFPEQSVLLAQPILPGAAKAILTLDNGETINLDKGTADILQKIKGTNIQVDSTTLNYQLAQSTSAQLEVIYNKVEIPRGGEYALVLSDGTKVHLNSMSSLRFPVAFTAGKREVELQGEAYFEVSKTGQPFIVNANGMQVEVLGTTFNISAYPDEEYQTTLVNGSVKVSAEKGESLILKPSQQATIASGSNSIQVRTVDTSFYTSWVKGKINFKDQRLEDIMKILSRWYDMKVIYESERIKNIRFGCNLNRYEEITPFVKLLEKTEEVHAKIEGNTITFHN